jgi:RNA polymerase sigma factor (sigma-70 family)
MTMRTMMGDWQLLQAYANSRSEAAFAEVVSRHLDWVYSVALRHVGDPHLAEDVVQSVFVLLARKARDLGPGTRLGGWLFRTTCHVAAHAVRAEQRRKNREATACTMSPDTTSPDTSEILWEQLTPHLDQAVAALPQADRSAILLRFYEKQPLRQVGEKLGVSEEAAKKRVSRAVERMREFLQRRGVKLTAVALAAVLAEKTVQAASAALASTVLKVSLASASASATTLLPQLVRETLRAWRRAKIQLVAGLGAASVVVVFVAANAGTFVPHHSAAPPTALADTAGLGAGPAAPTQSVNPPAPPAAESRPQLPPKTGALTGSVVDPAGHPIEGAQVWGGFESQPFARDTTDKLGRFALDRIAAPELVSVTADGYAADQQSFDPTSLPGPLVFRLGPVSPLKMRVVDEAGQGVAGVRLFLQQWWGRESSLGQYLAVRTDAVGRLQWLSPPKGEMELEFCKSGYRYSRTNKLTADGLEHVIVLHPVATVTGSVTDAQTGAPVPAFKYTLGHAQPWVPSDPTPLWDLHSQPGSDGSYKIVIEEEQVPYLRIEAEGYETAEAQIALTNNLSGVRDFQLKRLSETNSIRGIVLLPDGSPAAGVEVALCTATVGVSLRGTSFDPKDFGPYDRSQLPDYRRKTDQQGRFSFPPKPGAHTVAAVALAGLGKVHCFDFSQPLELRLESWARIEGTVRTRDGQWAGRKVQWGHAGNLSSWMTLFYSAGASATTSEAAGNFTLEHVPPGDVRVAIAGGPGAANIYSPTVHLAPGQTAQVQVGGIGRPVTGRLVAPPDLEIRSWTNQVTLARLQTEGEDYHVPGDLTGSAVERWKLEFEDTDAGRAWFRDQYCCDFTVGADGSFTLPEVLPGKYWLFVNVGQGYLGSGTPSTTLRPEASQIASIGMRLTVPDASQDGRAALDLGDIVLNASH